MLATFALSAARPQPTRQWCQVSSRSAALFAELSRFSKKGIQL
jgi:hypothetical protein